MGQVVSEPFLKGNASIPEGLQARLEGSRIMAEIFLMESFNLMTEVYSKQFCCDSKKYIYPCCAFPEEQAGLLIHTSQELKKS